MTNSEREPGFEQISQPKPVKKMAPREIRDELYQGDDEADEAKPMSFPAEGKITGARRVGEIDIDKENQFRLQDELEKMQKEMKSEINIANKISRQLKDGKDELRAQQVREKYEPRIAELADKLREIFGEKKGVEDLLPQLKQQAEESEDKRVAKIKKEKEDKATDRSQKIPVTAQKKWAQKDLENAHKKLIDAEDALTEAEKQRPGALSRFFSRFKIGKPSAEATAYQLALRAVEEAKKLVAETEKSILDSGIYAEPQEKKNIVVHGGIRFEKPAPAKHPATAAETSHKIPFKPSESEKPREQTAEEKFAELTRRVIVYGETKNIGAIIDYDYVSPAELTDKMVKKLFTKAEELNKSAYAEDKRDSAAIRKGLEHFRIYGATAATAESTRARAKARGAAIKREITPPDYSSIGGGGLGIDSVVKAMRIKK